MFKNIYKKNWKQKMMTWFLIWLNVNVATLNATLQLLERERERERERENCLRTKSMPCWIFKFASIF